MEKDYIAKSYIKIEDSGISTKEGIKSSGYSVCEALDRMKKVNGDFSLIIIEIGGKRHIIVASDMCVVDDATVFDDEPIPTDLEGKTDKEIAAEMNKRLGDPKFAIVGLPQPGTGECVWKKINNIWVCI